MSKIVNLWPFHHNTRIPPDLKYTSMICAAYKYTHPFLFMFYMWAVNTQICADMTCSWSLRINIGKSGKHQTFNLFANHWVVLYFLRWVLPKKAKSLSVYSPNPTISITSMLKSCHNWGAISRVTRVYLFSSL